MRAEKGWTPPVRGGPLEEKVITTRCRWAANCSSHAHSRKNQIARFVPTEQTSSSKKEGKCSICPSKKNRRYEKRVFRMPKVCNEHCIYLCEDCFSKAYPVDLENI
ncbi:hypothetical protein ACJJTC_003686 [Scirpophaga incertulas]